MKKYKLQQGFGITEENGTPIKEFGVNLYLNVDGISQYKVMSMLTQFSDGFTSLMELESSTVEKGFGELNKKLMKEGDVWEYDKSI